MKRMGISVFLLLQIAVSVFSYEITYRVMRDVYSGFDWDDTVFSIKEGTIVTYCSDDKDTFFSVRGEVCPYRFDLYIGDVDRIWFSETDIKQLYCDKIFTDFGQVEFIPVWYFDVLKCRNSEMIYEREPKWLEIKEKNGRLFKSTFYPERITLNNVFFSFFLGQDFLVNKVTRSNGIIAVHCYRHNEPQLWKGRVPYPDIFLKYIDEKEIVFLLQFDGDYVDIWINSLEEYMGKYAVLSKNTLREIISFVQYAELDLANVSWPHHADGTSEYENEHKAPCINLAEGFEAKLDRVLLTADNLRLRSGGGIDKEIMATLPKDTLVRVLEIGEKDTIDGILSNWVRVEVFEQEGGEIPSGTTGWCFGGYLQ